MTTQEHYQKVLKQEVTKQDFLWEVRRDVRFSHILTNVMSYEDTISVLKGKGFISEANDNTAVKSVDFLGTFKKLQEGKSQKLKGGKGDKLTADQVNYHEFTKGWKQELEHTDDIDKAKEIALDHLAEDPMYYTRLEMIEFKADKKNRTDLPIDISKKKADMKDPNNQMKPHTKKKEAPNVKETMGKQEKATSKTAGLKKMKGEGLPMKALKEAEAAMEDVRYKGGVKPEATEWKDGVEYVWRGVRYDYDEKGRKTKIRVDDNPSSGTLDKEEFEKYQKIAKNMAPKPVKALGDIITSNEPFLMLKSDYDKYQATRIGSPKTKDAEPVKGPGGETKPYEVVIGNNTSTYFFTDKQAEDRERDLRDYKEKLSKGIKMDGSKIYGIKSLKPLFKPGEGGTKKTSAEPDKTVYDGQMWYIYDKDAKKVVGTDKYSDKADKYSSKAVATAAVKDPSTQRVVSGVELKSMQSRGILEAEAETTSIFQKVIDGVKSMFSKSSALTNPLVGKSISMTLAPKGQKADPDSQWSVIGKVVVAKYNEDKNDLMIRFEGQKNIKEKDPGKKGTLHIYLKKDGQPDMIYFEQTVDAERGTPYEVVNFKSKDLENILNAKYKTEEPKEESVLESYIRARIRKAIQEGEEGQYIGMVGRDVKMKELEELLKKYVWGYQYETDPAQKSIGAEYNGKVAGLIKELGPEGVALYNKYATEPKYRIKDVSDLGGYTANPNSGLPDDGIYNPEKLIGRGGRMAEGEEIYTGKSEEVKDIKDLAQNGGTEADSRFIAAAINYYSKIKNPTPDQEKIKMLAIQANIKTNNNKRNRY